MQTGFKHEVVSGPKVQMSEQERKEDLMFKDVRSQIRRQSRRKIDEMVEAIAKGDRHKFNELVDSVDKTAAMLMR
jgi:hypothetical protein